MQKMTPNQILGTPNFGSQNRPIRLPGRGLNLRDTTNQEPHDGPWFGARGLNPGHQLVMPGGAPL